MDAGPTRMAHPPRPPHGPPGRSAPFIPPSPPPAGLCGPSAISGCRMLPTLHAADRRATIFSEFVAALRRPDPPPRGWAPAAALIITGTAAAIAALAVAGWVLRDDPGRGFQEGKPGTMMSVALLLAAAALSVLVARSPGPAARRHRSSFWLLLAAALVFLAADDWWMLHERLDLWVHSLVGADPENRITDHLDDVVVAGYGIVLAATAWARCDALLRSPWFVRCAAASGVLFAFMVATDIATDTWVVAEEGAKLMAEAFLVAGLLALTGLPFIARHPGHNERRTRQAACHG